VGIPTSINPGDAARLLFCSGLVLLAAPGLARIYAGLSDRSVGRSSTLPSAVALVVVAAQWVLLGSGLAFGPSFHGVIGRLTHPYLLGAAGSAHGGAPSFEVFQTARAVLSAAILVGALSLGVRARACIAVALLWSTLVYDPIVHWMWGDHGWLASIGAIDFCGGLVTHLTAGVSALVCLTFLGGLGSEARISRVRNKGASAVLVGMVLFSCGSFALAAGEALSGRGLGVEAFVSAALGAAGGAIGRLIGSSAGPTRRPMYSDVCSGLVVGFASMGVAGGYVSPWSALAIGFIAGAACSGSTRGATAALVAGVLAIAASAGYVAPLTAFVIAGIGAGVCYASVRALRRMAAEGPFDLFAMHAMGGLVGGVLTGILAHSGVAGADGALFGNTRQLGVQLIACAATAVYAGLGTRAILAFVDVSVRLLPHQETLSTVTGSSAPPIEPRAQTNQAA